MSEEIDNRPRILIVDDERFNLTTLNTLLNPDYRIMVATSGEVALKATIAGMPDLILLDINMPEMDGYEVCRRLKADNLTRDIPIIFITALTEPSDETKGLELGAEDYITKPFNLDVVRARVRTQIRLKQQNDILVNFAFIDGLTGLNNRRSFDNRVNNEWDRCKRSGNNLTMIIMDIDHFKLYNDHYGHVAGDDCLRKVAAVFQTNLRRASDFVARYGGEEFAVILPETDCQASQTIAEGLRQAVENLQIEHIDSTVSDHVTLSLGVASANPKDGGSPEDLINKADEMLYQAKQHGRNRVAGCLLGTDNINPIE